MTNCFDDPLCRFDETSVKCVNVGQCYDTKCHERVTIQVDEQEYAPSQTIRITINDAEVNAQVYCMFNGTESSITARSYAWVECDAPSEPGYYQVQLATPDHVIFTEPAGFYVSDCGSWTNCLDCTADPQCMFVVNSNAYTLECHSRHSYVLEQDESVLDECLNFTVVEPAVIQAYKAKARIELGLCDERIGLQCQLKFITTTITTITSEKVTCESNTTLICHFPEDSSLYKRNVVYPQPAQLKVRTSDILLNKQLDAIDSTVTVIDCRTDHYDCLACGNDEFQVYTRSLCQWSNARGQCLAVGSIPATTDQTTTTDWRQCPRVTGVPSTVSPSDSTFHIDGTGMSATYGLQVVLTDARGAEYPCETEVESSTRLLVHKPANLPEDAAYTVDVRLPNGQAFTVSSTTQPKLEHKDTGLAGYVIAIIVIACLLVVAVVVVVVIVLVHKLGSAGGKAAASAAAELS